MRLSANASTMPRLHLLATLALVVFVVLEAAGFLSWQHAEAQRSSFERIEQVILRQQKERLNLELRSAVDYLDFARLRTEDTLRASAAAQVDMALQMVETIYRREIARRPESEVRKLIIETLRPARFFDGRGYFFIDDTQGRFVLLPTQPAYEGRDGIDNADDSGQPIMRGLLDAAHRPAGYSYFRYRWYLPDNPKIMGDKVAYVRPFEPLGWIIGTGDYLHEWENLQKQEALRRLRALRFGAGGAITVLDRDGRVLIGPGPSTHEGLSWNDLPPLEREAMQKVRLTTSVEPTFIEYDWPRDTPSDTTRTASARKTALVSHYEPWGWTLAVSMYSDEYQSPLKDEIAAHERATAEHNRQTILVLLGALALGIAGSVAYAAWSRRLFTRYHRERQEAQSELRIAAIAFESQEGIFVTDPKGVILRVNRAFSQITGFAAQEAIGKTPAILKSGRHDAKFYTAMRDTIAQSGQWSGEIWNRRKDGSLYPEWLTITAVKSEAGDVTHFVSTLTDITQRKAAEQEIHHLAYYDPLTQLPNRRLLLDRLQQALATRRRTGRLGALMMIDLDHFKWVNDTLGHEKGDLLLQEAARALTDVVQAGDTLARLGGDEFVLMLEGLNIQPKEAAAQSEAMAEKVRNALAGNFSLDGDEILCACSIGVVLFTDAQASADDLMKHADLALYRAKDAGRNTVCFYDPEMHAAAVQRVALERELRAALQEDQLELHYQPQVNHADAVVGVEALVRWKHPVRGMVSPGEFIPLAEDSGLILPLGEWVLHTACEQLARWAHEPERQHLTISVNVSGRQLHLPDFVDRVLATLWRTRAPARMLKLELTESLLLEDPEDAIQKMQALQTHGVGFALDDFGTGYSSLAYLRQLPLSQLKIDQSFVHDVATDARSVAIVRTIVTLAQSLGMDVIAEGVETPAQRERLAELGCGACQGYLFGRPSPRFDWDVPAADDAASAPESASG